jgi:hypothetical protein
MTFASQIALKIHPLVGDRLTIATYKALYRVRWILLRARFFLMGISR